MAGKTLGIADDEDGYAPLAEINVTPFVDVMLVLLIIFMVAAPLMMAGVPVELPKTSAVKLSQPKKPVIVSLDKAGKIFVREEELTPDTVVPRLAALAREDPAAIVYVRGDKSLPYGRIMELMGLVGRAGFSKVSLIAEAPAGTPPRSR